ncbi:MAG: ERCC4 domain-containing protein [Verrucomicrobia bacterium]|nr:ERCC4 domain-containing protein [Verrucomicrobiota bacterium]
MSTQPVIVVDSREQDPLAFRTLPSVPGTLTSGDYSFRGGEELFAIERKSIADLVACCAGSNRERFERELHRLRGYRFARLLIVGSELEIEQHRYRSALPPKSVLHSVRAFEARYNVATVFEPCPERAAALVERWAYWFARECLKSAEAISSSSTPSFSPSNN